MIADTKSDICKTIIKSILYHSGKRIRDSNFSTMKNIIHMNNGVLNDLWTSLSGVFIIKQVISVGGFKSAMS